MKYSNVLFSVCFMLFLASCGGNSGSDGASNPQANFAPPGNSLINGTTAIVISFNQSMDIASAVLSGSMASNGGFWSSINRRNDTLTVSPVTSWNEGVQTLGLNVSNEEGVALGQIEMSYTVDDTAPTATETPSSGAAIRNDQPVVITFS